MTGSLLGAAGGAWAAQGRYPTFGPTVLAGALLAEAAHRFILVEGWTGIDLARTARQVALVDTVAAILVPLLLLERPRWPRTYTGSVGIAAVGTILLAGADRLVRFVLFR